MTIEQIQLALALFKYKSFTEAAEASFVSQSTLSKKIRALEDELGVVLFKRIKSGVVPTSAGNEFYPYAMKLADTYGELRQRLERFVNTDATFTVGVVDGWPEYHITQMLADFGRENPGFELIIHEVESDAIEQTMEDVQFDAVIAWEEQLAENLYRYPIASDTIVLAVPEGHPLALRENPGVPVSLAAVKDEPFILSKPRAYRQIDLAVCNMAGFTPKGSHFVSHQFSLLKMVAEGLGVSLVFESTYRYYHYKGVKAIRLKEEYTSHMSAGFLNARTEKAKALIRYIQAL